MRDLDHKLVNAICKTHTQAALDELDAQRFGGKQMTAGAARGE